MSDELTKDRLHVSFDPVAGPSLRVLLAQLPRVREILDRHQVRYWPDSFAITLDGKPAVTMINFGRSEDPVRIQQFLDEAS